MSIDALRSFGRLTALALAVTLSSTVATNAGAAGPPSVLTAFAYDFYPGDSDAPSPQPLRVVEGGTLLFANMDPLDYHTVTSVDVDEGGTPIFGTARDIGIGQFETVAGIETVPARSEPYVFICSRHPFMVGSLLIVQAIPK